MMKCRITRTQAILFSAILLVYPAIICSLSSDLSPFSKLVLSTLGYFYVIKALALKAQGESILRYPILFLCWPGMTQPSSCSRELLVTPLLTSSANIVFGFLMLSLLLALNPNSYISSWGLLIPIFLILHLGAARLLFCAIRYNGFYTRDPFPNPLLARNLEDFWSKRWNLPFVEMNKCLFRPLYLRLTGSSAGLTPFIFFISGLLHEFAISFPSGGGYGLPLTYFFIQGVFFKVKPNGSLAAWLIILLPLPLLFHDAFRNTFILGLYYILEERWNIP